MDSDRDVHCSACWIGMWRSEPGSIRHRREDRNIRLAQADGYTPQSARHLSHIVGHFRTCRRVRGHSGKRISWRLRGRIRSRPTYTSEALIGRAGRLTVSCRTCDRTLIVLDACCSGHYHLHLLGRCCVCEGAGNHLRRPFCETPIVNTSKWLIGADQRQADHDHFEQVQEPAEPGPVRCSLRQVLRLRAAVLLGWQSAAVVFFRVRRVGTAEVRIHIHLNLHVKIN